MAPRIVYVPIYHIDHLIIMCELNAILIDGSERKALMEEVVRLVVHDDEITLTGMFGDAMTIRGKILHVDITKQEALLEVID